MQSDGVSGIYTRYEIVFREQAPETPDTHSTLRKKVIVGSLF